MSFPAWLICTSVFLPLFTVGSNYFMIWTLLHKPDFDAFDLFRWWFGFILGNALFLYLLAVVFATWVCDIRECKLRDEFERIWNENHDESPEEGSIVDSDSESFLGPSSSDLERPLLLQQTYSA